MTDTELFETMAKAVTNVSQRCNELYAEALSQRAQIDNMNLRIQVMEGVNAHLTIQLERALSTEDDQRVTVQ